VLNGPLGTLHSPAALAACIEGALLALIVGDALAFPLHWYYSWDIAQQHLREFYAGAVTGYTRVHPEVLLMG
jgi:hypothetical protein